jgi:hypothetical protein
MNRYRVFQQLPPKMRGEVATANLEPVCFVEAYSCDHAIEIAKCRTEFKRSKGLAQYPVVELIEIDGVMQ